jgi:hypothetical protein
MVFLSHSSKAEDVDQEQKDGNVSHKRRYSVI